MIDSIGGHGLLPYAIPETHREQKPWDILKISPCNSMTLASYFV
jgi:hypothetical protein